VSPFVSQPRQGVLTCVFWDVQHGHATYIGTPDGEDVAIDAGWGSVGTGGERFSPLRWLTDQWGVYQLDAAVITHPHYDHVADLEELQRLRPRVLARPKLDEQIVVEANRIGRNVVQDYEDWQTGFNAPVTWANPVDCDRANGYRVKKFFPKRCPDADLNNRSIVTVVSYANTKLLIPGDNEAPSWQELLEGRDFVDELRGTDILLAAHHGREAGFCSELFDVIRPSLTVISDGPAGNTSVTSKYAAVTTGWKCWNRRGGSETRKVLTTRHDGAIVVRCGWGDTNAYTEVTIN
jgi:beta-lactamase superfamily II metal-dependent hydrolase